MTAPLVTRSQAAVSEWLPDDALEGAFAAIDECVATWSTRWFAQPVRRLDVSGQRAAIGAYPSSPQQAWDPLAPGIWVDRGEHTSRNLALHALGRGELRPKLTCDDEQLLGKLGERLAHDLAVHLGKAPSRRSAEQNGTPEKATRITLASASRNSGMAIAIDATMLVSIRKQQCAPWQPLDALPQSLQAVLGNVPVAFEVALGSVAIGLLEFEAIEPGDTIVLDQRVDSPLAVRAAVTGATIRDARLVRGDGQLTLTAS